MAAGPWLGATGACVASGKAGDVAVGAWIVGGLSGADGRWVSPVVTTACGGSLNTASFRCFDCLMGIRVSGCTRLPAGEQNLHDLKDAVIMYAV